MNTYVALDLETSGLNPSSDKIIEIGMIKVIDGEITDTYSALIDPQRKLETRISELTGITDEMLKGKPVIEDIINEIYEFIGDYDILGHNVIFDYGFLKKACTNAGLKFEKKAYDTLKIARRILPEVEHKNLDFLCDHFKIDAGNSHRALDDAVSAHRLFLRLQTIKPEDNGFNEPIALKYTVKKDTPITPAQKRYLAALMEKHGIVIEEKIETLTKSRASKIIDKIILQYGK